MLSSCLEVGCCVGSYTRCCRYVKESHRKTTKLAGPTHRHDFPIPIDFLTACIPVVLSYLFAYSHNLIHSYTSSHPILPYRPQAPKNPTSNQARPAFPAPQTRHPQASTNSLRRLPARYRMPGRGTKSAETSAAGSLKPTRQSGSLRFHRPTTGGHGHGVCGVREGRCMLWSDLRPDRQSGLGARQKSGLKVPHPGNPYS